MSDGGGPSRLPGAARHRLGLSAPPRPGPDLRLLPVVAPLWVAEALALQVGDSRAAGAAAVAGVLLAGALAGLVLGPPGPGPPRPPRAVPLDRDAVRMACLVIAAAALGVVVAALHVERLHPPGLQEVIAQRAVVRAEVLITADPRGRLDPGRFGPPTRRWSVPARLSLLEVRGRRMRMSVPVRLDGDQVERLLFGQRVALTGRAARAWSPAAEGMSLRVLGEVREVAAPGVVARATTGVRHAFLRACAGLPVDAAALLMGLAVGDESLLTPQLDAAMIRSGLAHLTAVSGSNTSLVAGLAMAAVAALGLGWRARVAWCLLALGAYVVLVRPQASVLRAAAMGLVALLAFSTGGRRRGPPALLGATLVLLLALPQLAVSLGFALSVLATAGLLLVAPGIGAGLGRWRLTRRVPEPLRVSLAVALAAHLATLPLSVLMGNGASLVAVPANMVVAPLVPPATVVGLAAALLAPVAPGPAGVVAHVAAPATAGIAWVAHTSAGLPFGVLAVPAGAPAALAVGALLLAAGWWLRVRRRPGRVLVVAVVLALLAAGLVHRLAGRTWPPPDWLVLACDVGQGDALLLRPSGGTEALLVDVGPDPAAVRSCLRRAHVDRVVVLLTHFHADHVDGLGAVLGEWPVTAILTSPVGEPADAARSVVAQAQRAGVPIRLLRAGDSLLAAGLPVHVLWPARRVGQSPANNASVVCLVRVPVPADPLDVLLTGDIEPEAQVAVMARSPSPVDVVKVPHHGSRSQDPRFAAWVGAGIALVSVGRGNDYGHPAPATLAQYRSAGATIGRTDEDGALAVVQRGGIPVLLPQR